MSVPVPPPGPPLPPHPYRVSAPAPDENAVAKAFARSCLGAVLVMLLALLVVFQHGSWM
ncbi:hypothetical protein OG594_18625 [Streptomyces sp. NBC_01214]|uniref:hypothetical protein n=1 Tax=Streptomyces sp. NBC_01214 TaxID=2903777 RepID=UPI00224F1279|nr:hypothetical protein [Streptomyces sp. NBC_01214]MCX4803640.1 hypothetical protein [Streptomyces sp. NBC_01214]